MSVVRIEADMTGLAEAAADGGSGVQLRRRTVQLDVPDLVWHDDVTNIAGWADDEEDTDYDVATEHADLYNNWTHDEGDTCLVEEEQGLGLDRGVSKTGVDDSSSASGEPCFICLEPLTAVNATVVVRRCKHVFHDACLAPWMSGRRKTCPACRAQIY